MDTNARFRSALPIEEYIRAIIFDWKKNNALVCASVGDRGVTEVVFSTYA
jgi:hypothetical protein